MPSSRLRLASFDRHGGEMEHGELIICPFEASQNSQCRNLILPSFQIIANASTHALNAAFICDTGTATLS